MYPFLHPSSINSIRYTLKVFMGRTSAASRLITNPQSAKTWAASVENLGRPNWDRKQFNSPTKVLIIRYKILSKQNPEWLRKRGQLFRGWSYWQPRLEHGCSIQSKRQLSSQKLRCIAGRTQKPYSLGSNVSVSRPPSCTIGSKRFVSWRSRIGDTFPERRIPLTYPHVVA